MRLFSALLLAALILPASLRADTNCGVITIDQANAGPLPEAGAEVDGYVVFISDCPPCPPGMLCEPCVPPHFIVSDRKSVPKIDANFEKDELIIFAGPAVPLSKLTGGSHVRVKLSGDRQSDWKFTSTYLGSFKRHLQALEIEQNPIPCLER